MIPVDYKSTGSLVLLPSSKAVGTGGNPYLFLGGLGQAMDVLTRRMTAPEVSDKLGEEYPKSTYTALPDVTSGSSIMVVTVKARTSAESSELLDAVLSQAPKQLAAMQDELKVPEESRISSMQVATPAEPIVDGKPRVQAVVGAGAAGLLLVLLMTAFLDGVLLRRAARREGDKARQAGAGARQQIVPERVPADSRTHETSFGGPLSEPALGVERIRERRGTPTRFIATLPPLPTVADDSDDSMAGSVEAAESSDLPPLRRRRAATGDGR
jgi:ElaB/YqjD/DUF883 family membrane-anchored ribosome-binding protein